MLALKILHYSRKIRIKLQTGKSSFNPTNNQILKVLMRTDGPARNEASPAIRNHSLETATGTTPRGHYLEGGSKLTDATYKNAISGEFVNLIDFLPSTEPRDSRPMSPMGHSSLSSESTSTICCFKEATKEAWLKEIRINMHCGQLAASLQRRHAFRNLTVHTVWSY